MPDGLGSWIWLCTGRLEQGKFNWAQVHQGETVTLSPEQLQALNQACPLSPFSLDGLLTLILVKNSFLKEGGTRNLNIFRLLRWWELKSKLTLSLV